MLNENNISFAYIISHKIVNNEVTLLGKPKAYSNLHVCAGYLALMKKFKLPHHRHKDNEMIMIMTALLCALQFPDGSDSEHSFPAKFSISVANQSWSKLENLKIRLLTINNARSETYFPILIVRSFDSITFSTIKLTSEFMLSAYI